jgi:hypothetical protein
VIFDWVGISNESHDAFRNALTEAVGTHLERVAVHTLHPHDAPGSDFAAERLLEQHGLGGRYSDPEFNRDVLRRLSAAAAAAVGRARPVAHYGAGSAPVHQVASTRRVQGPDGNVQHVRYSAERDARWRAHPEGTIDPLLKCVTLWDAGGQCICALSYYAVHPMSYYGQGLVGWDFVGIARHSRETALPGVPHLHFQGASGNITAGKYNDGSVSQRGVLAARIEASMKAAWESSRQHLRALPASDVGWHVEQVALPVRDTISGKEAELLAIVADESLLQRRRIFAARDLAFVRRQARGHQTTLARLALGAHTSVLFMPGELFVCVTVTRLHLHVWCMYVCMLCVCVWRTLRLIVSMLVLSEYQLAAQAMAPDKFVAMAAYGDFSPGYIGTSEAYEQGGYEIEPKDGPTVDGGGPAPWYVSRVGPEVEPLLMGALRTLLAA